MWGTSRGQAYDRVSKADRLKVRSRPGEGWRMTGRREDSKLVGAAPAECLYSSNLNHDIRNLGSTVACNNLLPDCNATQPDYEN